MTLSGEDNEAGVTQSEAAQAVSVDSDGSKAVSTQCLSQTGDQTGPGHIDLLLFIQACLVGLNTSLLCLESP